jgi:hypothetical protein
VQCLIFAEYIVNFLCMCVLHPVVYHTMYTSSIYHNHLQINNWGHEYYQWNRHLFAKQANYMFQPYEVVQFNSKNGCAMSLGCWDKQTHVPKRLDMFQLVFTWATEKMSLLFPSSRGSSTCPCYAVGGKMSEKNLEQQTHIKFCVKFGKSASEKWALLTLAYGE